MANDRYSRFFTFRNSLLLVIGGLVVGTVLFTVCLFPVFNKPQDAGVEVFDDDVVGVGEEQVVPEPYLYEEFIRPPNSFGMGNTTFKSVNWSYFKQLFNAHTSWMLEYKRYSYSDWTDGNEYLSVDKTWKDEGYWKINLTFTAPVDVYEARFTFGCDLPVLDYVERDSYEIWVNYTVPNTNETYNLFFNWSDLKDYSGLYFNKGVLDDMFWFRFGRQNIPAGVYVFDPSFGNTGEATTSLLSLEDRFRGQIHSPSSDGECQSISVWLQMDTVTNEVTCAIYDMDDDLIENGVTEEVIVATGRGWTTFDFVGDKPMVEDGVDYYLCVYGDASPGNSRVPSYAGGTLYYEDRSYQSGFPSSIVGGWDDDQSYTIGIYCEYDEVSENTAPTIECFTPDNESTGNNLSGYCSIWVNDTDADTVDITWRTNASGSWVTVADNNTVASGVRYDWYFDEFTSKDGQYWWEILCDDETDNVSKRFWYETEERVWQIYNKDVNGSYVTPVLSWQILDKDVNGSYKPVMSWRIDNKDINGSYVVETPEHILNQDINGSYVTPALIEQILNQDINGSYVVPAISLKIINTDINGSYVHVASGQIVNKDINGSYTLSLSDTILDQTINGSYTLPSLTEQILDQTINGSYVHIPTEITWQILDQTINGSYYIGSITETILNQDINGSYVVESITWGIVDKTINGSYVVETPEHILNQDINGSYTLTQVEKILDKDVNGSYVTPVLSWQILDKDVNGSYKPVMSWRIDNKDINGSYVVENPEQILDKDVNGSYVPSVGNENPVIVVNTPTNGTTGYNFSGYCRVTITDQNGNDLNITWRTNVSGSWITVVDNNSVSCNSSYDWYYIDMNSDNTIYWWELYVDDGTNNVSAIYHFTTFINATLQLSNEYPGNTTNIYTMQPTIHFDLDSPNGKMSYKLYVGDSPTTCNDLLIVSTGLDNGTYHFVNYYNATNYTTYYYRVHYNDSVTHRNETFNFNIVQSGGGGMAVNDGSMSIAIAALGLSVVGVLAFIRRRRR